MGLLTKTMISVVTMGLIVSAFILFYQGGITTYSPEGYDNTEIELLEDQIAEMNQIGNDTRTSIQQVLQPQGAFDVVGGLINTGFNTLKTPVKTFDVLFTTVTTSLGALPGTGTYSNILIAGVTTMLVLLIFVGIMLAVMIKSDRI